MSTMVKTVTMSVLATLSALTMLSAHAAETDFRIVNLQAEVVREVANDEMQAILYTELNEKDAATLAQKINTTMNQALATAKQYSNA